MLTDQQEQERKTIIRISTAASLGIIGFVALGMWGCPQYNVWQQGLAGEAELKRAEQTRQVRVLEARAKLEAAEYLNQAEVKRAEGVAASNRIIANGLGGPEGYLRYLWIQAMEDKQGKEIIYVPTEAGMPILEAGRAVRKEIK